MSIVLAVALAAVSASEASCSWDRPGANRYRGTTSAAIDRYQDIPEQVRATLKRRIAELQPDDRVSITRDAITGRNRYAAQIRDMHFGASSVCHTVTRTGWSASRHEPAAVYCVGQHCILVPKICGNVSRITRLESEPAAQAAHHGGPAAAAGGGGGGGGGGPASRNRAALLPDSAPAPQGALQQVQGAEDSSTAALPAASPALAEGGDQGGAQAAVPVAATDSDDASRNLLPGRGADTWTAPVSGWQSPGRDGGGSGNSVTPSPSPSPSPSPVPEPDTWAMLAAGLGALWLLVRRQALQRHGQP